MRNFIVPLLFLLAGCGYRLEENYSTEEGPVAINIPYIEGDEEGRLTAELIRELSSSGRYYYARSACSSLEVVIIDYYDENIGFRYDRSKKGKLKDYVIPVETRAYMLVEVKLHSGQSPAWCRAPQRISASIDYDHDYYTIRHGVNIFSLGQLTDVDSAEEAALVPLEKKMAEKIVDYVIHGW